MVFANFHAEDAGCSRQRVAICESEDDARFIAKATDMERTLQRAAHVLAEIAELVNGDERMRINDLRSQIVETIKQATPEHYGG